MACRECFHGVIGGAIGRFFLLARIPRRHFNVTLEVKHFISQPPARDIRAVAWLLRYVGSNIVRPSSGLQP